MKSRIPIQHEFVEYIPETLAEGTLYVSIPYATAVHKCFCGCGNEVVTPLSPTDWQLTFDGKAVSLSPSVGSWNLKCASHYWIRRDVVEWAHRWTRRKIETERARDLRAKRAYFEGANSPVPTDDATRPTSKRTLWERLRKLLKRGSAR